MLQHIIRLNQEVMDMPAEAPMVGLPRSCSSGRIQTAWGELRKQQQSNVTTVIHGSFESESYCCSVDESDEDSIWEFIVNMLYNLIIIES